MSATTEVLALESVNIGLPSVAMEEAIRFVGSQLVDCGHVAASYVDGMLEREKTVSTYLGNGVAMPHGTFESRDAVASTGIVVAQYPDGIDWGGVGTAHLVIGLAATGDDHVTILSHIAEVLQDEDEAELLWTVADAAQLHAVLNVADDDDDDDGGGPTRIEAGITISGEGGLHARPATLIVDYTKSFDGEITISKGGKTAKANSIMSVLSLGAVANDTVDVVATGTDADATAAAVAEIQRILTTPEGEL